MGLLDPQGDRLYLLCEARMRGCALPLHHVVELMRTLPVSTFPGAPECVLGLAVIRGEPTPVVDCGKLLGETSPGGHTRMVTVRCGQRVAALAFEAVRGVRRLRARDVRDLPSLARGPAGDAIAAVSVLDAELLVVLADSLLLPEALWTSLEGQAP
jgi:purine-binding chemotaxis protein CheW